MSDSVSTSFSRIDGSEKERDQYTTTVVDDHLDCYASTARVGQGADANAAGRPTRIFLRGWHGWVGISK